MVHTNYYIYSYNSINVGIVKDTNVINKNQLLVGKNLILFL